MNIYGLQKLTLLDYPGHTACTVFLRGCNFICHYCHNAELAWGKPVPVMSDREFLEWLETRKGLLDGVVISGGEPCYCRPHLSGFIRKIKQKGFLVKIDTNGSRPASLCQLIYECKVDYVSMDIKNSLDKYEMTTRVTGHSDGILESVRMLMESGIDYEFRTTVTASMHSADDFEKIGAMIRGAKAYYLQKCNGDSPEESDMQEYKRIMEKYVDHVEIRG